jgi:hypothetical protein
MAARSPNDPLADLRMPAKKLMRPLAAALERIHRAGAERDAAGNRHLFCDQYLTLLIFYFLNPTLTSLRSLQKATDWDKTQKALGIPRTSLGSLSEAQGVFDAALVEPIIAELARHAMPQTRGREAEALAGLTAVDGSIFPALSRMSWALWQDETHRGVKLHLQFDVLNGVPVRGAVTPAACSEVEVLSKNLGAGRLYVLDRGYACYSLFARVISAGSSVVARVKDNIAYAVKDERPIPAGAAKVGVIRDAILSRLGTAKHADELERDMRLVVVRAVGRDGVTHDLWLVTDLLDMDADLVALAYQYRWTVELYFRWLKCILGSRHLLAQSQNGVQFQMYAAMIVSLLLAIRVGAKPTKRTLEIVSYYLTGWVSDAEFEAHVKSERARAERTRG